MFKNFQSILIGLVGSFLFLTPFIIFFNSYNLSHLTNEELKLLLYFNLLTILLAIIISCGLRLFLRIKFNLQNLKFSDLFLFLGLFYYINFFYGNIQIFLSQFILRYTRYLAESIILLIFFFIIYYYIKSNNFKKFILIFISVYLFSNLILFTNKNFDSFSIDRFYSHNNIIFKNTKNIDNSNLNST